MLDDRVRAVLRRLEEETDARGGPRPPVSRALAPGRRRRAARCSTPSAAGRPGCEVLEIGGSRGYSTIWLGAAVRELGGHVTSLEADPAQARGVGPEHRRRRPRGVDRRHPRRCLRDASSSSTAPSTSCSSTPGRTTTRRSSSSPARGCEAGAVVVADNVISHGALAAYSAARQADPTLVSVTVPLDNGLEVTSALDRRVTIGLTAERRWSGRWRFPVRAVEVLARRGVSPGPEGESSSQRGGYRASAPPRQRKSAGSAPTKSKLVTGKRPLTRRPLLFCGAPRLPRGP